MAWTAPMTAVDNSTFSDVDYNRTIRDNLLETAPAKATAAGQYFVSAGGNAIAARSLSTQTAPGSVNTTSTSYVDLSGGPEVTVTCGTQLIVFFAASCSNGNANAGAAVSVRVKGGTYVPAQDKWCVLNDGTNTATNPLRLSSFHKFTDLNPGTHTVTMKYRAASSGTATYTDRMLVVMPL